MLIRCFGKFWNPQLVNWGSKGAYNEGSWMGEFAKKQKMKDKKQKSKMDFWHVREFIYYLKFFSLFMLVKVMISLWGLGSVFI